MGAGGWAPRYLNLPGLQGLTSLPPRVPGFHPTPTCPPTHRARGRAWPRCRGGGLPLWARCRAPRSLGEGGDRPCELGPMPQALGSAPGRGGQRARTGSLPHRSTQTSKPGAKLVVPSGQKQPSTRRVLFGWEGLRGGHQEMGVGMGGTTRPRQTLPEQGRGPASPPGASTMTDLDLQVGSSTGPQARYSRWAGHVTAGEGAASEGGAWAPTHPTDRRPAPPTRDPIPYRPSVASAPHAVPSQEAGVQPHRGLAGLSFRRPGPPPQPGFLLSMGRDRRALTAGPAGVVPPVHADALLGT